MDKIYIKDLELFANHGVFPEENRLGQKFIISAVLYTDTRKAGMTDDLKASIHYGEVSLLMKEFVEGHTFQLLETVVEKLAEHMLMEVPNLHAVELELKKPWAPVGLPLKTVSVKIKRSWHKAYVAFGSNMGEKEKYLDRGIQLLREVKGCQVRQVSDYIQTEPYGYLEQDTFMNGCLEVDTLLTPEELLEQLHVIEQDANRERKIHWGPRTLDLDIIFYDNDIIDTPDLHIPHIDMHHRDFVLLPMKQIAPYLRHPILNKTMMELAEELKEQTI
ncbi:MAG: 2-amino-4-hydroxy-6-hydroxymethyldihydropteridine diphosphokinase [Lachnospiraceae bacterium]|jgi:dihydroneopterin aldolase/2-amino-4-hydroxy-6-hydroxymethyldihydropteridine diphosphokinase|nr:2-amino-4-hydroxy-6-hydroxymethyldihydropteridine diphosphokinase [Lachnospiraceae bacterium]MDD3616052.1 2-amino-4-hydroxy-6-hydroxymethyldihydropteridine diphosphokinase [Lachnospiraceae bacterium]